MLAADLAARVLLAAAPLPIWLASWLCAELSTRVLVASATLSVVLAAGVVLAVATRPVLSSARVLLASATLAAVLVALEGVVTVGARGVLLVEGLVSPGAVLLARSPLLSTLGRGL